MNGHGKSESPVVPAKLPNKEGFERSGSDGKPQTGTKGETLDTAKGEPKATSEVRKPTAEGVEGRGLAEGNLSQQNMPRTQDRTGMPSALERIGEAANQCATPPQHLRQEPSALVPHARICAGGAGKPASLPRSITATTAESQWVPACRRTARILRQAKRKSTVDAARISVHTMACVSTPASAIGRLSKCPARSVHQYEKLIISRTT